MNNKKQKILKLIIITILLATPIVAAYYAINYFEIKSNEIASNLEKDGMIAGKTTSIITDITDEIPVIPNGEIVSVDRSNNTISMTISTNKSKDEIRSYYEDYFYLNNWEKTSDNQYLKDNKQMLIDFIDQVVKIEFSLKSEL